MSTLSPAIEQDIRNHLHAYLKQELGGLSIRERYPSQFEVDITVGEEEWFAFFYCYQGQVRLYSIRKVALMAV